MFDTISYTKAATLPQVKYDANSTSKKRTEIPEDRNYFFL